MGAKTLQEGENHSVWQAGGKEEGRMRWLWQGGWCLAEPSGRGSGSVLPLLWNCAASPA